MKIFLEGKWVDKSEKISVINPFNGQVVDVVPKASAWDVQEAIEAMCSFEPNLTAYERYQILLGAAQEVFQRKEEFSNLISREAGIALKSSRIELDRAYQALIISAEEAKRITGETLPADIIPGVQKKFAITIREPVGIVVSITPFNHPLNQVVHKVAPALAAGNRVILKPSEKTPLTALKFCEVLLNNGLPPLMLSVLTGDVQEISDPLLTHPNIDMISFTGSVEVGELILKKCGLKKVCLELGGNGALIVLDDANLNKAVQVAVNGAFSNSGQRCTSIKRILVEPRIADIFVERFVELTKKLIWGDPLNPETDVGTVIDEQAARKIKEVIEQAVKDGAKLLYGGKQEGALMQPTVLDYVPENTPMVVQETFGPTAPIIRVKDMEDAIRITNSTIYGLQCGLFTQDIDRAFDLARKIKVGAVAINEGPGFRVESLPFGGVKKSGIGREGIKYAIREMTILKTIII